MNQTLMNLVQQKANSLYEKITLQRRKDESKLLYFWKTINSVYLGCNDAFANVAGYKNSDELIGKSDADLI